MSQIQEGRLELLGVLFSRHSRRAYAQCYRMVGDGAASEDLVQEAFLRVLRHRDKFRGDARFTTWLHRIVRNVCLDHLGAEKKQAEAAAELAATPGSGELFSVIDDSEISVTRAAFDLLSEAQRRCLILARIDGWSYKEIAAEIGITEVAARVRVHRALNQLKSIIEDLSETES